ncbi:hypothetical protein [Pseudomonas schmalbachii]|uniref:Uncharacterized protein n=1 Tax=Pseudomonas schmalbachii TaxID=2816993 RepID=A0ABS3TKG7_9PSED|nr:hypothetical protein [Pseudomonas schmalbachii]MBO3274141.1 hypothetical protein [Pseudomonas schmalbachii]
MRTERERFEAWLASAEGQAPGSADEHAWRAWNAGSKGICQQVSERDRALVNSRAELATALAKGDRLRAALGDLVGATDPAELQTMAASIRRLPIAASEQRILLAAIDVLVGEGKEAT